MVVDAAAGRAVAENDRRTGVGDGKAAGWRRRRAVLHQRGAGEVSYIQTVADPPGDARAVRGHRVTVHSVKERIRHCVGPQQPDVTEAIADQPTTRDLVGRVDRAADLVELDRLA